MPGTNGTNGVDGAVGPQGPIGLTGAQGLPGANGTNGVDGAVGPQGPIGLTGAQGLPGANGAVGPQGPIGLTGAQGPAGVPPTSTLKNTNTITFDSSIGDYYGSVAAPRTGTLTFDTTGAVRGGQAVVYYNNSTLAIPTTLWTFGTFFPGQINKMYLEYDGNGNVICNIVNSGVDNSIPSTVGALTITNDVPSTSVKFVFATPTDAYSPSANLDILIYNGAVGSETLFATILKGASNKTIVGANMEITGVPITGGTTYQFSIKARDEAGNVSAAFSPNTTHTPPVATWIDVTNLNATLSASLAYTAGSPNQFASSAAGQYLVYNTAKTGAFNMKMDIKDVYTKSIGFGVDNSALNTDIASNWEAWVSVTEAYAIKVGAGAVDPNTPTTMAIGATNHIRLTRASAAASILLYYYNGTTEILVHTFAAASGSTYLKAQIAIGSRRIYTLQVQ